MYWIVLRLKSKKYIDMKKTLTFVLLLFALVACNRQELALNELSTSLESRSSVKTFSKLSSIDLGDVGAAEISSFDPITQTLFVVNNTNNNNRIDVVNLSNPTKPLLKSSIQIADLGGLVNGVAVHGALLAAAIESKDKTSDGKVALFNTSDLRLLQTVSVGALPDMVAFTPDGNYILTADEGEPNLSYTIDPIGTVSIIDIKNGYSVSKLNFANFKNQLSDLKNRGFRYFGPRATLAQDVEPEYLTISPDSRFAWVTLQENNAIARIDIRSKVIMEIFPLGFKNHYLAHNSLDPSDRDNAVKFDRYPIKGIYEPDGIALLDHNGQYYLFTANEGDAREYDTYVENVRMGSNNYKLDSTVFPLANTMKALDKLGRLNVTTALGDKDGDGDMDEIYTHGGRSFSIWNARSGEKVYDSNNEIDKIMSETKKYADGRSDDKGSEPESICLGKIGDVQYLFVALERTDAILVYNITNPLSPIHIQTLNTGVAPEGLIFISANESPSGKSLLIASCEGDGQVVIFSE